MDNIAVLVPMAFVRSVSRSIDFYGHLGFMAQQAVLFYLYAPRGEFRLTDPDGYALMITHT